MSITPRLYVDSGELRYYVVQKDREGVIMREDTGLILKNLDKSAKSASILEFNINRDIGSVYSFIIAISYDDKLEIFKLDDAFKYGREYKSLINISGVSSYDTKGPTFNITP